jgi:Mg2+ and Co2+ transporter CorA
MQNDDREHLPLIDMQHLSIQNEVNQVNFKIEAVENELLNMVDKSSNIYLVRAETLNLLMKYRERLLKKLDAIKGIKKKERG